MIAKVANPPGMRAAGLLAEADQILAGTDTRDLAVAATAAAKLGEVERQLAGLAGNARAERAQAYVKDQLKKLRLASIEAV